MSSTAVKISPWARDYIPEDNILSRVTPAATRRLLEDASLPTSTASAVWGGGYYPDDFFFDICDELGLMVWQDFMFACANYALDEAFERSVRREAEQNIRRIRHHACLALLCGNNENEMFLSRRHQAAAHGREDHVKPYSPQNAADYIKLNEYILRGFVIRLRRRCFTGRRRRRRAARLTNPPRRTAATCTTGMCGTAKNRSSITATTISVMCPSSGFKATRAWKRWKAFTLPQDRNIFSRIMEKHQRNNAANGKYI